jgi:hypothetical protein
MAQCVANLLSVILITWLTILISFASTPSLTTLKLLFTLSVAFGWDVSNKDISTAFLHALITGEDIYVIPPAEYYPDQNVVWKLKHQLKFEFSHGFQTKSWINFKVQAICQLQQITVRKFEGFKVLVEDWI